jgi:hypothetical protein
MEGCVTASNLGFMKVLWRSLYKTQLGQMYHTENVMDLFAQVSQLHQMFVKYLNF